MDISSLIKCGTTKLLAFLCLCITAHATDSLEIEMKEYQREPLVSSKKHAALDKEKKFYSFTSSQVRKGRYLLTLPETEENRYKVEKFLGEFNRHALSPLYYAMSGNNLHKALQSKFNLYVPRTKGDWLKSIPNMLLHDQVILLAVGAGLTTLAVKYWLPSWQASDYQKAYNDYVSEPFQAACHSSSDCEGSFNNCYYGACKHCNQRLDYIFGDSGQHYFIKELGGCRDQEPILCPEFAESGVPKLIELFNNATSPHNVQNFIDPETDKNGTYVHYFQFGRKRNDVTWGAEKCFRDLQGAAGVHGATVRFSWSMTGIATAYVFFAFLFNMAIVST